MWAMIPFVIHFISVHYAQSRNEAWPVSYWILSFGSDKLRYVISLGERTGWQ